MAKKSSARTSSGSAKSPASAGGTSPVMWFAVALFGLAAIIGAYQYISARSAASLGASASGAPATTADSAPITGPEVDGTAVVSDGVQKITVNVTNVYNPNVVYLKAGVPTELTFAGGQGCTVRVQSESLGFAEGMAGGPVTVKLDALQPGTYPFACGMNMVHGKVVVR